MKKIMSVLCVMIISVFSIYANVANESNHSHNIEMINNKTCSWRLKYTTTPIITEVLVGGRSGKSTVKATVLQSCIMEEDQYVTVNVYFGDKHIGSGVVVIPAGRTSSAETEIEVSLYGAENERGYAKLTL